MEQSAVLRNMQMIEDIFREVQELFPTLNEEELVARLEFYPLQFRSIAYEAASMLHALADLKAGNHLPSWEHFFNQYGIRHSTQCNIGAGWAFAQQQINPSGFFRFVQGDLNLNVLDGYGYYEGMFRRRKSVLSQQQPDFLDELTGPSYYRGLGRSLWYSNRGNIEQVAKIIAGFPDVHKQGLWTGLGTAIAYVGGCDVDTLQQVLSLAGNYAAELKQGAQTAALSRNRAGTCLDDVLNVLSVFDEQVVKALEVAKSFLGEEITVVFDRPIGSVHPQSGVVYPLNYGYIPNTVSGDGEELDAYFMGADKPLEKAAGICVAVIHRFNESDDKLVVVPNGTVLTNEEIRQAVHFQERWFSSIIITC